MNRIFDKLLKQHSWLLEDKTCIKSVNQKFHEFEYYNNTFFWMSWLHDLQFFQWTLWLKLLFLLTHIYTNIYSRNSLKKSALTPPGTLPFPALAMKPSQSSWPQSLAYSYPLLQKLRGSFSSVFILSLTFEEQDGEETAVSLTRASQICCHGFSGCTNHCCGIWGLVRED